jgi:hypothetical protein
LALLPHPQNRWAPAPWFTRDYGFMSPTPMYWPSGDNVTRLAKGEVVVLRYRVLVFGAPTVPDLARAYADYARSGRSNFPETP